MSMTSPDLKRFLDAKKSSPRLVGDVERHLMARPLEDRATDVLHPSEMVKSDWCHRASWFALNGYEVKKEKPNLRLQSIFDEGHAIHTKWQNWFQEMGVLYGKFQCVVCNTQTTGTSPQCEKCNQPTTMNYQEVTLVSEPHRIAGHTDGWIKGIGEDCLIEIKSIGSGTLRFEAPDLLAKADGDLQKAWRSIRRPFNTHLRQGQMYLELLRLSGTPVNEIVFIYELKADQDYREFVIKADSESVIHLFDAATEIVSAKEPMECNVSASGCKSCQQFGEHNAEIQ
jgi:hypothetical protein